MFSIGFLLWGLIAAGLTSGMGLVLRRKPQVGWAVVMFVVFYIISWLTLPPLAVDMADTWWMLFFIAVISAVLTNLSAQGTEGEDKALLAAAVPLLILLLILGVGIVTSSLFNSARMANVINLINHGDKESTLALVSQEQAQRVTSGLALKRGAELIGSAKQPGLASVAEYGEIYANVINGNEPVWVAPLVHTGFWRWLSNSTTPGYFVASHVNVTDSRLVEDQSIAYGTEGFYWWTDLKRHVYLNGYVNYNYGTVFFQIDDEGVPHYVVPLERPQVGFYSNFPERWLIVNATTGAITEANTVADIPTWVDRAYSQDVMEARIDDWGCFLAGFWACYFSKVDVVEATPGMVVTMDNTNTMIYVTGTQFSSTKANSEGATSGVATVNARTGQVDYYRRQGITEVAAKAIMNGAVSNFAGWSAENPILIQVNGIETYFAVITDASGARKSYGMVSQRSRDVYGIGENVQEAVRAYLRSARNNRGTGAFEGNIDLDATFFDGLLLSVSPVSQDGETSFYVRLDTVDNKIFRVSSANIAEIAVSLPGEPVRLSTSNTEPGVIEVDSFDNLLITLELSAEQVTLDENAQAVMNRYDATVMQRDVQARISSMTPEELQQLLQALTPVAEQ